MRIVQINTTVNTGSTGRITEEIGDVLISFGHESYIAFGRGNRPSHSKLLKIGGIYDVYVHVLKTMLFDRHGFGSMYATNNLVRRIHALSPDAIGLHNLHGYYLNIQALFTYLRNQNVPVLWTLFDCWAFTGHCSYFEDVSCMKWQSRCFNCPKSRAYPASYFSDNSTKNFEDKKRIFTSLTNLHLVVHSYWLASLVKKSFLKKFPVHIIASGVDLNIFRPCNSDLVEKYNLSGKKIILGCANIWTKRKGLADFIKLAGVLPEDYKIILIGINKSQVVKLPASIIFIERTENSEELAAWYSIADVFVNPTYTDNFPTTNIESLACGTPVITYNTGGSPESIDEQTGIIIEKGDITGLVLAIQTIVENVKHFYRTACRTRAQRFYDKNDRYKDYCNIYEKIIP